MQYNINDIKEKIQKYKDIHKYSKTNSCPKEFNDLDDLMDNIRNGIKNACTKRGIIYANSFDLLLDYVECSMLSSRNWFNEDALNFTSVRDILKIDVKTEEEFVKDFKLQYTQKGTKQDRKNDVIELVGIAQSGVVEIALEGYGKWSYLKNMRLGKILIENNSDFFKTNMDFKAVCSKPLIKKNYNEQNSLLICIHYHSFVEKGDEYSPLLEKFELILVHVK